MWMDFTTCPKCGFTAMAVEFGDPHAICPECKTAFVIGHAEDCFCNACMPGPTRPEEFEKEVKEQ